jgi:hypothetical protein
MKDYRKERWEDSLAFGQMVEDYVLSRIRKTRPKAFRREGNHPAWDIYVPETKTKIEVKSDVRSNKTGNYVIETSYGGRASAFTTSTADLWCFFNGYKLIWITKAGIKKAIKESGRTLKTFRGGTDHKSKTAYLIPEYYIETHSTLIEEPLTDMPDNFKFGKDGRNER